MASGNCIKSNMNINIWRKIFKYLNIFEYSFQRWLNWQNIYSFKIKQCKYWKFDVCWLSFHLTHYNWHQCYRLFRNWLFSLHSIITVQFNLSSVVQWTTASYNQHLLLRGLYWVGQLSRDTIDTSHHLEESSLMNNTNVGEFHKYFGWF